MSRQVTKNLTSVCNPYLTMVSVQGARIFLTSEVDLERIFNNMTESIQMICAVASTLMTLVPALLAFAAVPTAEIQSTLAMFHWQPS